MPLNLIFVTPGNYRIEDNGIPGDNTSVIRDGTGAVIFTFIHPADSLGFTTSAPGVNLAVNLTDTLGAANLTIGSLTSAATSPDSISIANVRTTGIVTLVANGAITELGSDAGADIIAGQVILSAGTGVGTPGNAIETQTGVIEAETNTGDITLSNFGAVQIGGASADVDGLEVLTSGNINFSNVGTILLGDDTGTESVRGGGTSGDVTLVASGIDSDILANVDNDAITVPGGNLVLEAGRDIGFGIIGSNFDNDVRARGSITIDAGRDFLIDGFADLASDDFNGATGGNVSITVGRNIHVRSVAGTDGSIFANGPAGADVILTTGANGALVVDPASIVGAPQPIASSSGDVIVNADRILINSASGIGATAGEITLNPATAGREINLGSASDAAFALELSDAELDRIFTPTLTIGNNVAGQLTVSAAISPANVQNLALRSGTDIAVQAGITTSGSLDLRAGDNLFLTSSPTITVGGALTIAVDAVGGDGNVGGVAYFGNASVSAASITISGAGDNDMLGGFESVDQTVHGNGGNDTITSSGEGHYFGDAGNDVILAGLSSGLVPEVLDGGSGIDTIDTRSFNGDYVINLATGATNFNYESFVNFENVITGGGNDQITGNASANTMQGMAGDDRYYVDNAGDKVIETAGGGNDRVLASVNYALDAGAEIELFTTTNNAGAGAVNLTGNEFSQTIVGNAGANVLDGKGGADTMYGYGGNDWYYVDNGADKVIEAVGGGTADRVFTSINYALAAGAEIELFTTTDNAGAGSLNLTGNEFSQTIVGNAGANALDGGKGGNDALYGFDGTDTFLAWSGADMFNGGDGTDTVSFAGWTSGVSINLDLATAQAVPGGSVTLSSIENITGGNGADTLRGSANNNVLSGGNGADTFLAWSGADTFNGGDGTDTVSFAGWGSGVSIDLHLTGAQSVSGGSVTLSSIENVIGGNGADTFHAWSGANSFAGGNGSDTISFAGWASGVSINLGLTTAQTVPGGSLVLSSVENAIGGNGNDTFVGTSGANLIAGGNGNDTLTGGGGADVFLFNTTLNATANVDHITDYNVANDTIQLDNLVFAGLLTGTLASDDFVTGTASDAAHAQVIYNSATGALLFDDDGTGAHATIQFATITAGLAINNAEFMIV